MVAGSAPTSPICAPCDTSRALPQLMTLCSGGSPKGAGAAAGRRDAWRRPCRICIMRQAVGPRAGGYLQKTMQVMSEGWLPTE